MNTEPQPITVSESDGTGETAVFHLNYPGRVNTRLNQVMGPNPFGELMRVVSVTRFADRSRVGFRIVESGVAR